MTENFAEKVGTILDKSIEEGNLPVGTLSRIAHKLARLEQDALAETVANFAKACAPELEFFRAISQIPAPSEISKIRRVQNFLRQARTYPMIRSLSHESPFKLIEGLAIPESVNSEQLSGPFFIAVAGDFSEDHIWTPQNRAYLFSPAFNAQNAANDLELRILTDRTFEAYVTGEQGKDNRFKISLYTRPVQCGHIQELFETAVENMAKFSFGPGSCPFARDAFKRAVDAYVPQTRLKAISPIASPLVTSLKSGAAPLTLDITSNK